MRGKYQVRKVRRDGVTQRYWVAPTSEHDSAVLAVMRGDLATAESRREQELARQLMQLPLVQESVYRSLVRQYEETKSFHWGAILFLQHYLSRGYPEAEALLVRLATEPSNQYVRGAAIYMIAAFTNPRVPRLLREVADRATDDWTARTAIDQLSAYFDVTMRKFSSKKLVPTREEVLDTLETLGLALQGKWYEPKSETGNILNALKYNRSEFERAAQGQIPDSVEKTLIDGLMSILASAGLHNELFEKTLDVIKEWGSEYAIRKLRSYLRGALPQWSRGLVIDAINEIEQRLKRKSR